MMGMYNLSMITLNYHYTLNEIIIQEYVLKKIEFEVFQHQT